IQKLKQIKRETKCPAIIKMYGPDLEIIRRCRVKHDPDQDRVIRSFQCPCRCAFDDWMVRAFNGAVAGHELAHGHGKVMTLREWQANRNNQKELETADEEEEEGEVEEEVEEE
ncbi:hypothetical protein BGZ83_004449, partial [Gryganskiella cystojenkinii]